MTDDLSRRDFLGAAALAAAAIDAPALDVRRLLGPGSGLQPNPRAARLGYAQGGGDRVVPPESWDVGDGYGDAIDQSTYLKDLIHLGLPNGDFAASDADDTDSDHWTLTNGTVSWAVVVDSSAPGGYVLRYTSTTSGSTVDAALTSARVPLADVHRYAVTAYFDNDDPSNAKHEISATIRYYDEAGNVVDTQTSAVTYVPDDGDKQRFTWTDIAANTSATDAAEAEAEISVAHIAAGAAGNLSFRAILLLPLRPAQMVLDPAESIVLTSGSMVTSTGSIFGSDVTAEGNLDISGTTHLKGMISPSFGSNQNDWNPAGLAYITVIRAVPTAAVDLTGIVAGDDGRLLLLINVSTGGGFDLTIKHENAASSAANRIRCPNSVDLVLNQRDSVWLWYDSASTRWRAIGT